MVALSGLGVLAIRSREPLFIAAGLWILTGVVELLTTGKGLFGGRPDIALSKMLSF